jgi:hypothetical protein
MATAGTVRGRRGRRAARRGGAGRAGAGATEASANPQVSGGDMILGTHRAHRARELRPPRPDHPRVNLSHQRIKHRPVLRGSDQRVRTRGSSQTEFWNQQALGAAQDAGVHLPAGPALQEVFEATVAEVGKELDWAAIAEVIRRGHPPAERGPPTPVAIFTGARYRSMPSKATERWRGPRSTGLEPVPWIM